MSKAPDGEGCPRCDGHVYAAEQMLARGRVSIIFILYKHIKCLHCNYIQGYHRRCFKCLTCNRTLDSTIHCDGPDKEIYCKGEITFIFHLHNIINKIILFKGVMPLNMVPVDMGILAYHHLV